MEHWYALYTKPKKEHQVDVFLQGQGIVTYLPTVRRKIRRRDRPDRIVCFPCYLFARLDFEKVSRSSVAWMPGVRRIVGAGEQPTIVADEVLDLIQRRLVGKEEEGYDGFKPGDRVRIMSGPLRDLDAVFDRPASAAERVRVLLDVLGRMTPVEVNVSEITRVHP
jgi:transcription elongation factor/antiterminator RfaH